MPIKINIILMIMLMAVLREHHRLFWSAPVSYHQDIMNFIVIINFIVDINIDKTMTIYLIDQVPSSTVN